MRWFRGFVAFFVLFLSFMFSGLIGPNVSAVSDLVTSFQYSSNGSYPTSYICNNSDSSLPNCSDFHYVLISISNVSSSNSAYFPSVTISLRSSVPNYGSNNSLSCTSVQSYCFFSFDFTNLRINAVSSTSAQYLSSSDISITLLDHIPFGSVPSGSLSISQNGTFDVSQYSEVVVDVPGQVVVPGDYHDDLQSIHRSILLCGGVLLVIYFFYSIYRLIIKSTGGQS